MKKLFLMLGILSLSSFTKSQNITWQSCFGGTAGDWQSSVAVADSSNYVTSITYSTDGDAVTNHGSEDILLIKTDLSGNKLWSFCYGAELDEVPFGISPAYGGGVIIVGVTNSDIGYALHGQTDLLIMRISASGTLLWKKFLGGPTGEAGSSVIQTSDGNYVISGISGEIGGDVTTHQGGYSDAWMLEIDSSGSVLWQHSFGGTSSDCFYRVSELHDGFLFTGYTQSSDSDVVSYKGGASDAWAVKVDLSGDFIWEKTFGGSNRDFFFGSLPSSDGGIIITGFTQSSDSDLTVNYGGEDLWVVSIDGNGNLITSRNYGGTCDDEGYGILPLQNGGIAISGTTSSLNGDVFGNHGGYDFWVLKLDNTGEVLSTQCYGGQGNEGMSGANWPSMVRAEDGNILVATTTYSDNSGDVVGDHSSGDLWILEIEASDLAITNVPLTSLFTEGFTVFPTLVSGQMQINFTFSGIHKVTLYDNAGKKVTSFATNDLHTIFYRKNLPSGIYFISDEESDGEEVRKVIFQ